MEEISAELRLFINDNFLFGQGNGDLTDSDSFIGKGIIDSTGVLELVAFLEQTYHIAIEDHELIPENLDSIIRLSGFVKSKLQGHGQG